MWTKRQVAAGYACLAAFLSTGGAVGFGVWRAALWVLSRGGNAVVSQAAAGAVWLGWGLLCAAVVFTVWGGLNARIGAEAGAWRVGALFSVFAAKAIAALPPLLLAAFALGFWGKGGRAVAAVCFLALGVLSVLFTPAAPLAALDGRLFFDCLRRAVRRVAKRGVLRVLAARLAWGLTVVAACAVLAALSRFVVDSPRVYAAGGLARYGAYLEPLFRLAVGLAIWLVIRPFSAAVSTNIALAVCGVGHIGPGAAFYAWFIDFGGAGLLAALGIALIGRASGGALQIEALAAAWLIASACLYGLARGACWALGARTPGRRLFRR